MVHVLTTEYEDGVAKKVTQPFRAYSSYEESFADYARLIGNSPRYETVAQARNEVEAARHPELGLRDRSAVRAEADWHHESAAGRARIYAKPDGL